MLTHLLLWDILTEIRLLDLKQSGALTHMNHVHRTMVIRFDESSWPAHDATFASFVQACYNTLNRTIAIFLLVRQQLEHIYQVVTQPQRCCVCFEHTLTSLALAPICTTSILFGALHSYWPPQAAPPVAVLLLCCCRLRVPSIPTSNGKQLQCGQKYDKVTPPIPSTGATIRRNKSVLFLQKIPHNAQTSNFILCHFLSSFAYSSTLRLKKKHHMCQRVYDYEETLKQLNDTFHSLATNSRV